MYNKILMPTDGSVHSNNGPGMPFGLHARCGQIS